MFWTKAGRIKELEESLDKTSKAWYRTLDMERESYKARISQLEAGIKDLAFQKDTLDQLLKQLRINVKLPVRTK
jgi:flagellar capping protein FliD